MTTTKQLLATIKVQPKPLSGESRRCSKNFEFNKSTTNGIYTETYFEIRKADTITGVDKIEFDVAVDIPIFHDKDVLLNAYHGHTSRAWQSWSVNGKTDRYYIRDVRNAKAAFTLCIYGQRLRPNKADTIVVAARIA